MGAQASSLIAVHMGMKMNVDRSTHVRAVWLGADVALQLRSLTRNRELRQVFGESYKLQNGRA